MMKEAFDAVALQHSWLLHFSVLLGYLSD